MMNANRLYSKCFSTRQFVNPINFHLYHYAGNNPVKYTDPDGRESIKTDPDYLWISAYDKAIKSGPEINLKILEAIKNIGNKSYIDPDYMCDQFVEEVLNKSGYGADNYLAGKASEKNVQNHIDNALSMLKISKTKKTEQYSGYIPLIEGAYVVFMNEGVSSSTGKIINPHTGILRINKDGSCVFTHNSSGNSNKGISSMSFSSVSEFQEWYDYNSFYYYRINED